MISKQYTAIIIASLLATSSAAQNNSVRQDTLSDCPSTADDILRWRVVKKTAATIDANQFALKLASCLESPNPVLRDQIAYEVLTYWLRNDKLDQAIVLELRVKLLPWLARNNGIAGGDDAIARAFAALVLSELVRHDGIHKKWTDAELTKTLRLSIEMFERERDYRGLDPDIGWIHTIAHGSDLLWRLSLHPNISSAQLQEILNALATQIARPDAPAYTFNEADRLARVVLGVIYREQLSNEILSEWINKISKPAPLLDWNKAFASPAGMARLHNTKQFLRALRQGLQSSKAPSLVNTVDTLLSKLP